MNFCNLVGDNTFIQSSGGRTKFTLKDGTVKTIKGANNVTIVNGEMFIDGVPLEEYEKENHTPIHIKVVVEGEVSSIEGADEVEVHGNVGKVKSHNGNIRCHDVTGDVSTHNGNVYCNNVGGDVETHNGNITHNKH